MEKRAVLALADGTVVHGTGLGAAKRAVGEVVFNTSMTGYVEALTDPSYNGQILMFTYPLIGNYAVPPHEESEAVRAEGAVVHEACARPSHWESSRTLDAWLEAQGTPGIAGVDTRALTRNIRAHGVLPGILEVHPEGANGPDPRKLVAEAEKFDIGSLDLVKEVAVAEVRKYPVKKPAARVALVDCGTKENIARELNRVGLEVVRVPAVWEARRILDLEPDGVVVSNGPGDPAVLGYARRTVRKLAEEKPLFGICLGHQLLALAMGGKTYKMKFGHRGSNQPVKDLETGRVFITSQNHGYSVDPKSLDGTGLQVTRVNANDQTVEGLAHRELPVSSVQYHPEASPGPHDSKFLFGEFAKRVQEHRRKV
ncbi:MAG: glutamine-hydrolyzing carbamoyl-phosphate synthase small subunit [Halobacteria archaeon]